MVRKMWIAGLAALLVAGLGFVVVGCSDDDGGGTSCGNNVLEGGEVCDGTDLGIETCITQGFTGGTLACRADCQGFDTTNCVNVLCPNGEIDTGEDCDGNELGGETCTSQGFTGGDLSCNANCTFNVDQCTGGCGNNVMEGTEECDGTDFGTDTCQAHGFTGGNLACNACVLDLSGCTGGCGNNQQEGTEECDGTDLAGETCVSRGYDSGNLTCTNDCNFDETACVGGTLCTANESISLSANDVVPLSLDTLSEDDTTDVSCEDESGTADRVIAVTLDTNGTLVATTTNNWHVFALFLEPTDPNDCLAASQEISCMDPYYDGAYLTWAGLNAGTYYLVISDYDTSSSGPLDYQIAFYTHDEICNNGTDDDGDGAVDCDDTDCQGAVYCNAEICDNGVDDNLNLLIDCLEASCVGTTACTGGVCTEDLDLGTITDNPTNAYPASFDTSTAADDITLPCNTTGGGEYVVGFTLGVQAWVYVDFTQAAASDNYLGFFFEAGSGQTCLDSNYFCFLGDGGTNYSGSLTGGTSLPPGNYWFITEGAGTGAGSQVDLEFTLQIDYCGTDPCASEPNATGACISLTDTYECVCSTGYLWNPGTQECEAFVCQATDLGTFSGTTITTTSDNCAGTTYYGNSQLACTGYAASGPENVYSLTVPNGSAITVTMAPQNTVGQDASLYLLADCGDLAGTGCLVGADGTGSDGTETVDWTNSTGADMTIYIVADMYDTDCDTNTLTIESQ